MDVDNVLGSEGRDEVVREYLHVACEHDQIAMMFLDEFDLLRLDFAFVFFRDGQNEVGNPIEVGDTLIVRMV